MMHAKLSSRVNPTVQSTQFRAIPWKAVPTEVKLRIKDLETWQRNELSQRVNDEKNG